MISGSSLCFVQPYRSCPFGKSNRLQNWCKNLGAWYRVVEPCSIFWCIGGNSPSPGQTNSKKFVGLLALGYFSTYGNAGPIDGQSADIPHSMSSLGGDAGPEAGPVGRHFGLSAMRLESLLKWDLCRTPSCQVVVGPRDGVGNRR